MDTPDKPKKDMPLVPKQNFPHFPPESPNVQKQPENQIPETPNVPMIPPVGDVGFLSSLTLPENEAKLLEYQKLQESLMGKICSQSPLAPLDSWAAPILNFDERRNEAKLKVERIRQERESLLEMHSNQHESEFHLKLQETEKKEVEIQHIQTTGFSLPSFAEEEKKIETQTKSITEEFNRIGSLIKGMESLFHSQNSQINQDKERK